MKKKTESKHLPEGRTPSLPANVGRSAVQEIWSLYHLARRGRMDVAKAARLTFMLAQMGKLYEMAELERRVRELEERQASK